MLEVNSMNPRWISLAVLMVTVVLLGLVPAAQAEVRVSPNYRLDSDSSPFRGRDQTALAVNRSNPQHVVQINANYLDLTCESSVSFNGGDTWSAAVPLPFPSPGTGAPFAPSCSTFQSVEFGSGQNVYTTATAVRTAPDFPDASTLVFRSTDGGLTWQSVIAMAGGPGRTATTDPFIGPTYSRPSLSVHPGAGTNGVDRVYLTALGGNFNRVETAVSNDAGASFSAAVIASPPGTSVTDSPSDPVVNSDGSVTIAWRTTGTQGLIQARRSTDGGQTWGPTVDVTQVTNTGTSTTTHVPSNPPTGQSTSASYPRMTAGPGGHLYLVFNQGSGGPNPPTGGYQGADHFISPDSQVYFTRSTNRGDTWSEPKLISEKTTHPGSRTHQTRHPSVSFANGRINIVWHDRRHWYGGPGERNCTHSHIYCQDVRLADTYLSYSTDNGSNFSKPLRISDRSNNDDVGYDTRPSAYWNYGPQSVTVGGGRLLIGWMDSREGNWDTDNEDSYLAKVDFNATGAPPRTNIGQPDAISRSVALSKLAYPAGNEGALVGGVIDPARPAGCVAQTTPPGGANTCPGGPASRNASAVVIVNQGDVAGALAGAVLGRANPAPVLLSPASGLPASVKAEVARIRPAGAFVIGDTSKLSPQVITDLTAAGVPTAQVTRLSGGSDAATAALVAAELDKRTQAEKDADVPAFDAAVIANPASPDAAAVAGLAAARRLPVLYVGSNSIPAETQAALDGPGSLDIDRALVIGGPPSVSEDVRTQVGTLIGSPATRLGGANQYATSKAVVAESKNRGLPENVVYFADGAKPMDAALLGGVVARGTGILALAPAPLSTTAAAQAADFGLTGISRLFLAVPAPATTPTRPSYPGPYPGPDPGPGPVPTFSGCPTSTTNVIRGTAGNNRITGTAKGDRIFAGAGNDVVSALAGNDCVDLGAGADRGQGGAGNDLVLGGRGKDRIGGGSGRDKIRGGADADRLEGGGGNDSITGSAGKDRLTGGSGRDTLSGGSGNDRISARDRSRDRVSCGGGRRDIAIVDRRDRVSRNCELVRRRR
jgi:RTX calcium-binding nonapeptide repeat (4 copies)/ell wall binding domain 2 (CWB2)